jgi:alpha-ribazole phosphatase
MKLIFVRHGETNENAGHCYLGHTDSPLNEAGRKQIGLIAEQFLQKRFDKKTTSLFSSDLVRAQESARIIGNGLKLTPTPEFALRELNFGDWECLTYEQIKEREPLALTNWIDDPFSEAPPNGETLAELGARFDAWLEQVLLLHAQDETLIIVCHGGPIRWFSSKWLEGDEAKYWQVEGVKHGTALAVDFDKQTREFTRIN